MPPTLTTMGSGADAAVAGSDAAAAGRERGRRAPRARPPRAAAAAADVLQVQPALLGDDDAREQVVELHLADVQPRRRGRLQRELHALERQRLPAEQFVRATRGRARRRGGGQRGQVHVAQQRVARGRHRQSGRRRLQVDVARVAGLGAQQAHRQLVGHPGRDERHREAHDAQARRAPPAGWRPACPSSPARRRAASCCAATEGRPMRALERHLARAASGGRRTRRSPARPAAAGAARRAAAAGAARDAATRRRTAAGRPPAPRCAPARATARRRPVRRGRGAARARAGAQPVRGIELAVGVARHLHVRAHELHAAEGRGARGHVELQVGQRRGDPSSRPARRRPAARAARPASPRRPRSCSAGASALPDHVSDALAARRPSTRGIRPCAM